MAKKKHATKYLANMGNSALKGGWWLTVWTAKTTWKVGVWTAKTGWKHREKIGETIAGAASIGVGTAVGTGKFICDAASIGIYNNKKTLSLKRDIEEQASRYASVIRKKEALIDSGIISGTLLGDILSERTELPEEVRRAYELAYPGLAENMGFREAVARYNSTPELQGFISGVKGKLFEMEYVHYLNSGNLPSGYEASLASSPIQEGWDIAIKGPDSHLANVFQLKATDSVGYVKEAIEKHPDIDIVTTNELHSQLVMHSVGPHIINSSISDKELTAAVEGAVHQDGFHLHLPHLGFPAIALALIAFSAYTKKDASIYQRSFSFGERASKSMIAYGVGAIISGITHTWWIAILGSIATRFVTNIGRNRREMFYRLRNIKRNNDVVIKRFERLGSLYGI